MKRVLLSLITIAVSTPGNAQLLDRVRNKLEQKAVEKIDQSIDKATQKKKTKSPADYQEPASGQHSPARTSDNSPAPDSGQNPDPKPAPVQDINSYSRFDFIAGEKIIVHEDFSQEELGDFPAKWNTRSSAEVVKISNRDGKWMRMAQTGIFYPEYLTSDLPENFTLQLDLMANQQIAGIGQWMITFVQAKDPVENFKLGADMHLSGIPNFKLNLQPGASGKGQMHYSSNLIGNQYKSGIPEFRVPDKPSVKISIWRQKQRVRVYFDSTKVLDLPRALDAGATFNSIVFSSSNPEFDHKDGAFFMSNIRLAVGAPNLRSKLIDEGKFSTNGILFDVNNDQIKPQSYGSLQDIAKVLQENASIHVKIIGHTDADGNEATNLELSKRRAASVVKALVSSFGIDAARLESDGKGKAEPVDTNDTAEGKANNRRVEFIKL
jgi:OOP family OmpA-OmpF porin